MADKKRSKSVDFVPIGEDVKAAIEKKPDQSSAFINEGFFSINWKNHILLFLIFLLITSTMFISQVIGKLGNDMIRDTTATTNKGTVVQGILLVLLYATAECLTSNKII